MKVLETPSKDVALRMAGRPKPAVYYALGEKLTLSLAIACHRFGRGDADYVVNVFLHHHRQSSATGFRAAGKVMEVGPGRNVGTSLLMWALNHSRSGRAVTVILWHLDTIDISASVVGQVNAMALPSARHEWCIVR